MDAEGPEARFGQRVRELRLAARPKLSQRQLAADIGGYAREYLSQIESGDRLPSPDVAAKLDERLGARGELTALRGRMWLRRQVGRAGASVEAIDEEVDETDRRQFTFAAAGMFAAKSFRESVATEPDSLTLSELDDALNRYAATFTTIPHQTLAPDVFATWSAARRLLSSSGGRIRAQARLGRVVGYSSYFMSRLAFNVDDPVTSRRFCAWAGEAADQLDDPILDGAVAEMRTTLAFYSGQHAEAVAEARRGQARTEHPYVFARLVAYEARALAALGDRDAARARLDVMRRAAVDLPARPGTSPFAEITADMFAGGVLARAGFGDEAEPIARRAVDAYERGDAHGFEDHGHALLALSAALARRRQPEPDEAAACTARVLDLLDGQPTSSVETHLGKVVGDLHPFAALPPVRDLQERLTTRPRQALPPGSV